MIRPFKRTIRDLSDNRFINTAAIITIALAVLTVGTFGLVFFNAEAHLNMTKSGIRLIVYLQADTSEDERKTTKHQLESLAGIEKVHFISKDDALKMLTKQLKRQSSLLEGINQNPLPDAFELSFFPKAFQQEKVAAIADQIEKLPSVVSVEYGQEWFRRFAGIFNLFKMGGYVLGGVLTLAAILIVANTIRIVLYTRKDEIDIMRLVGASDGFIKGPFYLQGIFQGAMGSLIGIMVLYIGYLYISLHIHIGIATGLITLQFIPLRLVCGIFIAGMVVGWAGSFFSLKQFLKA